MAKRFGALFGEISAIDEYEHVEALIRQPIASLIAERTKYRSPSPRLCSSDSEIASTGYYFKDINQEKNKLEIVGDIVTLKSIERYISLKGKKVHILAPLGFHFTTTKTYLTTTYLRSCRALLLELSRNNKRFGCFIPKGNHTISKNP